MSVAICPCCKAKLETGQIISIPHELADLIEMLRLKEKELEYWKNTARSFHELIEARKDLHYHAFQKEDY
jgi:hypothetical protein